MSEIHEQIARLRAQVQSQDVADVGMRLVVEQVLDLLTTMQSELDALWDLAEQKAIQSAIEVESND